MILVRLVMQKNLIVLYPRKHTKLTTVIQYNIMVDVVIALRLIEEEN